MTNNNYIIREIEPKDNQEIAKVIKEVLIEFGVPKVGTAYEDAALDCMYETYDISKATYFLVLDNNKILGGAGIMHLKDSDENICELQKMYFSKASRGKGLGAKMMETCLKKAKEFGYDRCYLETLPYMKNARKLYKKTGFTSLDKPMGNTGHYSCNMWMIKDL
ncbi:GNAT family N-acetyltransferase [Urechidicola sp. KH5]